MVMKNPLDDKKQPLKESCVICVRTRQLTAVLCPIYRTNNPGKQSHVH